VFLRTLKRPNILNFFLYPILKNSLVYYDGEEEICINICKLHLIEEIVPSISSILKDLKLSIDSVSNCSHEICNPSNNFIKLPLDDSDYLIWHENHFDVDWLNIYSENYSIFPSNWESRIENNSLQFQNINFSSIYYRFNLIAEKLTFFISTKEFEIKDEKFTIQIPKFVQYYKDGIRKDEQLLIPIKTMNYKNVELKGDCIISVAGVLYGENAEDFDATIIDNNQTHKFKLKKGENIYIYPDGKKEIESLDLKTRKLTKYKIIE
jgi:hypothetical protein